MLDRLRRWAQTRERGQTFNLDCEEHMEKAAESEVPPLQEQLEIATREVAKWPEWKRRELEAWMLETTRCARVLAKPLVYFKARNEAKNGAGFNAVRPAAETGDKGAEMSTAPKDRLILVWAPGCHGLSPMFSLCQWHEDAGFCIDELRQPERWWPLPEVKP